MLNLHSRDIIVGEYGCSSDTTQLSQCLFLSESYAETSEFIFGVCRRGSRMNSIIMTMRETLITTFALSHFSRVQPFATPWTIYSTRFLCPWGSPGKNTAVGCHFLFQGIFPTQGLNPRLLCLLYCRQILYHWATREALNCFQQKEKLSLREAEIRPRTHDSNQLSQNLNLDFMLQNPLDYIMEVQACGGHLLHLT